MTGALADPMSAAVRGRLSPAALPLFRELGDLKRIRSAEAAGSIAERLFVAAWAALIRGEPAEDVMARVTGAALVSARLGDIDLVVLDRLGIGTRAESILERAFDELADEGVIEDDALRTHIRGALPQGRPQMGPVPPFVGKLARQPRAGVTCPGRPRIMLQPPENHAEHCLMVAVYGVIASPWHRADATRVFLAGLAHHLHNADMPDSGYSGEMLLGEALNDAIANARAAATAEIAEMAPTLVDQVEDALAPISGDSTGEARAFHVADVLDRVLEIEQFTRAGRLAMDVVLGDYGLVHDGPVKAFHDRILADAGLA